MKISIKPHIQKAIRVVDKKSPQLLTAFGITGFVTTCVLVAHETPKVVSAIDEAKAKDGDISKTEIVKIGAKGYWPAITTGGVSITCIIAAMAISKKRYAGLLTAYIASRTSLEEYKKSVEETLSENDVKAVEDTYAKRTMEKNPETEDISIERRGNVKCYDAWSGRYFPVTYNELKALENHINKVMVHDGIVYLEEMYDFLNIDSTRPSLRYGWTLERDGFVTISPNTTFDDNMRPCYTLDFKPEPSYDP